jgi:hypothetical protein
MKGFWALFLFVVILIVANGVNDRLDRLEELIVNYAPVSSANANAIDAPVRNKVFPVSYTSIWYTERGSVKIPVNGSNEIFDSNLCFHEIWFQEDIGLAVGQLGSSQWLLDGMGRKISGDFHKFSKKDGQIYGYTATDMVPVKIQK